MDKFFTQKTCSRCGNDLVVRIMSKLSEDVLCLECADAEKKHPLYKQAIEAEIAQVKAGNYNYPGLLSDKRLISSKTVKENLALLPAEVELQIPSLYSTEETPLAEKMAVVKYFSPYSGWTWFATEGSWEEEEFIFFGLVFGLEKEWGFFSLRELETATKGGVPLVERDLYFKPTPIKVIEEKYDKIYKLR